MGDAGLDYEIRLDRPDNLLKSGDVLRVLNDWAPEPFKMIGIFMGVGEIHPFARQLV